jgi:thymidine phosphorylase
MERIIDAQGRNTAPPELGRLTHDISASADGVVRAIDCFRIARIARLAGAPLDKGAGLELLKKTGDSVRRSEALYRIYACAESEFRFATEMAAENSGYTLS